MDVANEAKRLRLDATQAAARQQAAPQWLSTQQQNLVQALGQAGRAQTGMLPPEQIQALLRAQQMQQQGKIGAPQQAGAAKPIAGGVEAAKPVPFWSGRIVLKLPDGQVAGGARGCQIEGGSRGWSDQ